MSYVQVIAVKIRKFYFGDLYGFHSLLTQRIDRKMDHLAVCAGCSREIVDEQLDIAEFVGDENNDVWLCSTCSAKADANEMIKKILSQSRQS